MDSHWEILIVDDDEDIHAITRLALKNRRWRRRSFNFTSAKSAAEAREILTHTSAAHFDVAIVDVVMESKTSGLDLCEYIRAHCPPSLRIILRTGQPGTAPEHVVLSRFDIDYYLSKAEVDESKLYSVICACLRSSLDIATLLSFGRQIRSFASVLQGVTSLKDLLLLMHEGLKFLALKYNARILFTHEVDSETPLLLDADLTDPDRTATVMSEIEVLKSLTDAHDRGLPECEVRSGPIAGSFVYPFTTSNSRGGIFIELDAAPTTVERLSASFQSDLAVFVENWRLTYTTLKLQEQVAKDRMLQEKMYLERLQSIASMVAGVAHEINTPLGVASVANSMIERILLQLPRDSANGELIDDLNEASKLMSRNIFRAHNLIKSFKQLSSSQLSDQRAKLSIGSVIDDCFLTMAPELKKAEVVPHLRVDPEIDQLWDGFPGHLSQVILNFVQNVLRYAYTKGGEIFVRIGASERVDGFRIEFEDKGAGIPPDLVPRVFDPFVTTGRNLGGTGLGLAISHNIITNILKGSVSCESKVGVGTTFIVDIPRFVPNPPNLDLDAW